MRQKLALVLGVAAGLALLRLLRRRRGGDTRSLEAPAPDSRVAELRRKLAETREESADARATPAEAAAGSGVEDERRRVYAEGQAAVEDMRRSGES